MYSTMAAIVTFNAIAMDPSATTAQWSLCGEYTLANAVSMLTIEFRIVDLSLLICIKFKFEGWNIGLQKYAFRHPDGAAFIVPAQPR
jgi:hypothetical protein